jgi:DNA-binding CsgD family transcriptional regulator/tetratricopeptide (TPR) repeat protein
VCSGDGIEQNSALTLLGELVYKSLVVAAPTTDGAVRYRMLEPIRQYAREKLEESGEAEEVKSRHVAYFLSLAEEAEPELAGPRQKLWVERLEAEHENLREALSRVLERGETELGLRFGGALWRFWLAQGYISEGIRWLEEALAGGTSALARTRVRALEGMGWLTELRGDFERAEPTYAEMLELSRALGEKGSTATALNSLAVMAASRGNNVRARALLEENMAVLRELDERNPSTMARKYHVLYLMGYLALLVERDYARGTALWEQSLELARELGRNLEAGMALGSLSYAAVLQGDNERATAHAGEALAAARELGSAGAAIVPEALVNRGLAALGQGNHDHAMASFEEALVLSQNLGLNATLSNTLEGMASLAAAVGEAARAARLWGVAEASREVTGIALPPGDQALHETYLAGARSRLGEKEWEVELAEGRATSLDRVVEYALSREESAPSATLVSHEPPPEEPMGKLTRREQDVALLVARGFTNRQISTELGTSERTASNHVASILRKLGLRSRTQIAGWVAERRMLTTNPD